MKIRKTLHGVLHKLFNGCANLTNSNINGSRVKSCASL